MPTPEPEPEDPNLTNPVGPAHPLDVNNLYFLEAQRQISQNIRTSPPVPPLSDQSSPEVVTKATPNRLTSSTAPFELSPPPPI